MTIRTILKTTAASAFALACAQAAQAEDFNIPSGDLARALNAYTQQTGQPLIVSGEAVRGVQTRGAKGNFSQGDALTRILAGTGFTVQRDSGVIAIVRGERQSRNAISLPSMQLAQATPARAGVETVTVTSSKLGGADVQSIPIAITALSQEQLTATQTAGGPDLVKQVPNLTFSKTNFTGYNIQIRGIGTQAISVTTDPAVAVAFNDTPFIRNHFFEQEFYDVAQVEVLRGPQGTLYGRNATAGVVNLTSAVPTDRFEAMGSVDIGNYKNRRLEAMLNLPIARDKLGLRLAGEWTKRNGYSFNSLTNSPIDGRDLWSSRATLRWHPVESVTADLIWEHFSEDDDRLRSAKQLCERGAPPESVLGISTSSTRLTTNVSTAYLNQGCLPRSMYAADAFGVPNSLMLPYYGGLINAGAAGGGVVESPLPNGTNSPYIRDAYASTTQSRDLRVIESTLDPKYKARNDTLELNATWDVTPRLTLNSATGYNRDFLWSTEDFNRFNTQPGAFVYDPSGNAGWSVLTTPDGNYFCDDGYYATGMTCSDAGHGAGGYPSGIFCDPQLGCSNRLVGEDLSEEHSWQISQELRLTSHFEGPFNFSVGGNYMHYTTDENYYVFFNTLTAYAATDGQFGRGNPPEPWFPGVSYNDRCVKSGHQLTDPFTPTSPLACLGYIDPNPIESLNNQGHNYFLSRNPYFVNSYAVFGETNYNVTDDLKLTAGLRWTDDQKHFVEIPSEVLTLGYGYPSTGDIDQEWKEFTGRFVASWSPKLDFTDQSMFYASYAHGYKAGGANPPGAVLLVYYSSDIVNPTHPLTFKPEFNDAFELGTKNTAFDGALTFNADVFYYDYKGYQISQIVDRTSINLNFDATVKGAEVQATWEPLPGLKFGFAGGYEHTRIADGSQAIDLMDRTAGNSDWVVVKPFATQASNCVAPAYVVGYLLNQANGSNTVIDLTSLCGEAYASGHDPVTGRTYTAFPTGNTDLYGGAPIDPSYPGFDPRAGTPGDPYTGQNTFNGIDYGPAPNGGTGFNKNVSGNELPNAPHYTVSLTADYTMPVSPDWAATLHSDFYWQSASWGRVFNDDPYDRIRGYTNVNFALILTNQNGWQVMGYLKNAFDTTAITGTFLNSDDTGLTTNIFLTDPRLFGVRVTKNFDGGGLDLFSGTDGKHPQVWLQFGGNFSQLVDGWQHYRPSFVSMLPDGLPSPTSVEESPNNGFDWEGKLSIQPEDSDWVLKAGIRYGRSGTNGKLHKSLAPQTANFPVTGRACTGILHHCTAFATADANRLVDAETNAREQHTMVDFTAGKEIGIGMFGADGKGTIGGGVRMAQLDTDAFADLNMNANWVATHTNPRGAFAQQTWHLYEGVSKEHRSFHGWGPQVTWDADQPVWGVAESGQISIDWGLNAALLLGQQQVDLRQLETDTPCSSTVAGCVLPTNAPQAVSRSRHVVVPNLGGYVGASMRYHSSKISFGYRADTFFNAMDGGQAAAKSYGRGFYGPYLNVSLGLGG